MATLKFGQPDNGIIQMGYVVEDLSTAMAMWTERLRIGPWFVMKSFGGIDPLYRGLPTSAQNDIAFGCAGHMQYELIMPLDDEPSVWNEFRPTRGSGFHHFGLASRDVDADVQRLESLGHDVLFSGGVPSGGRATYLTGGVLHSGMIELLPVTEGLEAMFDMVHQASRNWDGGDPVRIIG